MVVLFQFMAANLTKLVDAAGVGERPSFYATLRQGFAANFLAPIAEEPRVIIPFIQQ